MKQASGLLLVSAVISTAAVAQDEATEKGKAPDYFPLTVGTKWIYEVRGEGLKKKLKTSLPKFETIDGKKMAVVETVVEGMVTGTVHMVVTDKGVLCHRMNGVELSPPICLLKYPVKKDDTWEVEATLGSEKMTVKGKAVDTEEVTVPAGKYKAAQGRARENRRGDASRPPLRGLPPMSASSSKRCRRGQHNHARA